MRRVRSKTLKQTLVDAAAVVGLVGFFEFVVAAVLHGEGDGAVQADGKVGHLAEGKFQCAEPERAVRAGEISPGRFLHPVAADGIKSMQDLRGKTFAIPHRQSSHYILLNEALAKEGVDISEINIIELPPPEMPSALAAGRIAGYCVAEPFGARAVTLKIGHVLYNSQDLWPDSICCALALSGRFLREHPELAAVLLSKAIGKQLTCVFVDHGLLRKNEGDEVEAVFGPQGPYELNFIRVNAQQRYYDKLKGVTEPEQKRKIIGEEFIRVFEEEAKKIGAVDYLVQGTIYPDVIESGLGKSAVIKSHHNVGGLPDVVDFKEIIEPLRLLFKDEVRKAGLELGIPEYLVFRQPFPGPGLGIRIIGEVTEEKVKIVQEADAIYREEIAKAGLDKGLGQYFAALTNMRSVGVMGDFRTYDYAIALRAVNTSDFMTADAAQLPWEVLAKVTNRIVNEVKGVNRVMYDCTGKPPATIEFE